MKLNDLYVQFGTNTDLEQFRDKELKDDPIIADAFKIIIDLYDRRIELSHIYDKYLDIIKKLVI